MPHHPMVHPPAGRQTLGLPFAPVVGLLLLAALACSPSGEKPAGSAGAVAGPEQSAPAVGGAGRAPETPPAALGDGGPSTVGTVYPRLASSSLLHARLEELPDGELLRSDGVVITRGDLEADISTRPADRRDELHNNAFFLLEQMATEKLLVQSARRSMPGEAGDDGRLIQLYLGKVVEGASVTEPEVEAFYAANRDAVGGATLAQIVPQIRQYLLREKQQEMINRHVRSLGQRTPVAVSAGWAGQQAKLAGNNPVDRARASGRPTFANFGAKGCIPCDKMEPIREALRKKYEGRLNVVFVHVGEQPILASRYGVQGIPLLVFYGADGEEVFRHSGFFPQENVEEQLAQLGL